MLCYGLGLLTWSIVSLSGTGFMYKLVDDSWLFGTIFFPCTYNYIYVYVLRNMAFIYNEEEDTLNTIKKYETSKTQRGKYIIIKLCIHF